MANSSCDIFFSSLNFRKRSLNIISPQTNNTT
nr:MAG TPA: hypothetical protein [Caudoviricetes sp.]